MNFLKLTRRIGSLAVVLAFAGCAVSDKVGEIGQQVGTPTVSTDLTTYAVNQAITLSWSGMPGNPQDWVAIVAAGSPPNSGFAEWTYINGQTSGSFAFNGLAAGDYEARAYQQDTYTVLASSTFTVSGPTGTTITTDQQLYLINQTVTVSYTGMPGNPQDFVAIVTAGSPADTGFIQFAYTNGATSGSQPFTGLAAGNYEARAYLQGTFTVLASTTFTVTTATITTDQTNYLTGQSVTATWSGLPGNPQDWVAIVTAGSPPNSGFIQFAYTNGQTAGSQVFSGIPAGSYEARAYLQDSYTILATTSFTVSGTTISTDLTLYAVNQPVTVTWTGTPGNAQDFIAIAAAGAPPNTVLQFVYTNGQVNGSNMFTGLAAGNYEARAYLANSFTILATSTFAVTGATISTDASTYTVGQTVTVTYAGLPGNATDYIAIAVAGSPDNTVVAFQYTGGMVSGMMQFSNLAAGTYEARAYLNGTFTVAARSPSFTITVSNACTSAPVRPVLGSLASGDLIIDTTQTENTAALTVPLASSILFVSMSENEPSPAYGAVVCELHDVDMTNPAGVTCARNDAGTDTGSGQITIHWTVATFTSGVSVQRGDVDTHVSDPTVVTLTAVDPTQSFVLLGGMFNDGSGWGNNEFVSAQLVDAQTLNLTTAVAGTEVSYQVVTMVGASVQRGTTSLATTDTQQQVTITTAPAGSIVLASYTTDNANGVAAATLMLRSSLSDPNTISFQRDLGGSNLNVSWEVASLPYATDSGLTTFQVGDSSETETVPGIVAATSVAICSSQSILGQSSGSTSYAGAEGDLVGEAAVTLTTGAGSVTLQRGTSQAGAEIPWTVIDFAHDCTGL